MKITIETGRRRGYSVRVMSPGTSWYLKVLGVIARDNPSAISPRLFEQYSAEGNRMRTLNGFALLKGEVKKRLLAAANNDELAVMSAIEMESWGQNLDAVLHTLLLPVYKSLRYQAEAINIRSGWQVSWWTRTFSPKRHAHADPHRDQALGNLFVLQNMFRALGKPIRNDEPFALSNLLLTAEDAH